MFMPVESRPAQKFKQPYPTKQMQIGHAAELHGLYNYNIPCADCINQGILYIGGRGWYRMCCRQSTMGKFVLKQFQIFCNQSNSQFYSWLMTAHAVSSPSPCIENSLHQPKSTQKSK
jgi:hypothetical protein